MGKKTKRKRIDKFYTLAKEQGYRARSAFKLVQLDKKYNFLSSARALIDLCAAPGGWMQVARKYMPVSSVVIGVDLVSIKPIRGTVSLVQDITTTACRVAIKKEMRDYKVDVVLNDGAPNMGSTWIHDAYTQLELSLHALKLAAEFLAPEGTFVSKVFRSKDYNAFYWVCTQLFKKVEATKPSASRGVSAEIYVVCQGFLAPKKIDPRLLDPKYVFRDVNESVRSTDLFKNKKKLKPNRDGYDEHLGQILHKRACVTQFINAKNPIRFLASIHELSFDPELPLAHVEDEEQLSLDEDEDGKPKLDREAALAFFQAHARTTPSLVAAMRDVRLLSKAELKRLLLWRERMVDARKVLLADLAKQLRRNAKTENGESDEEDEDDSEAALDRELNSALDRAEAQAKRRRKKMRAARAKQRQREMLGMNVGFDQDLTGNIGLFDSSMLDQVDAKALKALRHGKDNLLDKREQRNDEMAEEESIQHALKFRLGADYEEGLSSDEYGGQMDDMLDRLYDDYKQAARLREAAVRVRKLKGINSAVRREMMQLNDQQLSVEERQRRKEIADADVDYRFGAVPRSNTAADEDVDDSLDDSSGEQRKLDALSSVPATTRAAMWFDQSLFDGIDVDVPQSKKSGVAAKSAVAASANSIVALNDENFESEDDDDDADEASEESGKRTRKRRKRAKTALERADARRARAALGDASQSSESSGDEADLEWRELHNDQLDDVIALHAHGEDNDESASESSTGDSKKQKAGDGKKLRDRKKSSRKAEKAGTDGGFEVVPLEASDTDSDSDKGGDDAQLEALAYARSLVNGRRARAELEDNAFNRRAFADTETLPDWFVDNERAHNQVSLPYTKEDIRAVRERQLALNARPIKKVVEAQMRKRKRAERAAARMKKQADAIADQADITDKQKMRMLEKLYRTTKKVQKRPDRVYMVSRTGGSNAAKYGTKIGRTKLVDPRLKADKRGKNSKVKKAKKSSKKRKR